MPAFDDDDGEDYLGGDWVPADRLAYYKRLEAQDKKGKGVSDDGASRRLPPIDYENTEHPSVVARRKARELVDNGGREVDALALTADEILAAAARGDKRVLLPGGIRQTHSD